MGTMRAIGRYQTTLKQLLASSNGCGGRCASNVTLVADLSTSAWLEQQANSSRWPRSFLRPEMVSPRLEVSRHIPGPSYVGETELPELAQEFQVQNEAGVSGMRAAGRLAALIRDFVGTLVQIQDFCLCIIQIFSAAYYWISCSCATLDKLEVQFGHVAASETEALEEAETKLEKIGEELTWLGNEGSNVDII